MNPFDIVCIAFTTLAFAMWSVGLLMVIKTRRAMVPLARTSDTLDGAWPLVSVIIPALNEASTIEDALRSKLTVDYPALEIVVVNDRSTDETGAILDRLAAEDSRVTAVHIAALPDGWLGKVHALHVGAACAKGELLVFSDADVHFEKSALKRAVRSMRDGGFAFLTLFPQFLSVGLVVDATVVAFARIVASGLRVWDAENPTKKHAIGVGAFSMVARDAFARTEGFAWLKCEIADDVALAMLLKQSGARCGVRDGAGFISLTFYPSIVAMVRAVEKQGFSIIGQFSFVRTVLLSTLPLAVEWVLVLAFVPEVPMAARVIAGSAGAMQLVVGLLAARTSRLPLAAGVLAPVGMSILAFAMLRSAAMAFVHGGVRWRGTVYPSAMLREGRRVTFP
jgi:cellulose synthase/poly-beta-1,6-N-acetylglucosamine synthase-like glycosyltransferase